MYESLVSGSLSIPLRAEGRSVLAKFFRALGDPNRLALLSFISEGERSASECVEHLSLAQSRVSSHLACLVFCGLIAARREGRFTYYSISSPQVSELVSLGHELAAENAASVASCVTLGPALT